MSTNTTKIYIYNKNSRYIIINYVHGINVMNVKFMLIYNFFINKFISQNSNL